MARICDETHRDTRFGCASVKRGRAQTKNRLSNLSDSSSMTDQLATLLGVQANRVDLCNVGQEKNREFDRLDGETRSRRRLFVPDQQLILESPAVSSSTSFVCWLHIDRHMIRRRIPAHRKVVPERSPQLVVAFRPTRLFLPCLTTSAPVASERAREDASPS
jgi:hypothetical protein